MAPPFKNTEFDIIFGKGISKTGELVDLGVEHKIIEKSGTWFSYKDERLGQGRENAKNFLDQNPDIAGELERRLKETLGFLSEGSRFAGEKAKEEEEPVKTKGK